MRVFFGLVLTALTLYAAIVAYFYLRQSEMLYPAGRERRTAAEAGLRGYDDVALTTEDDERLVAWYKAAAPGKATLLYFHGNGGSLSDRRFRTELLTRGGRGLLIMSYRGYSGSTGKPSEAGLRIDARAAYAWLAGRVRAERIVLYGESLGSGVAVSLASERPIGGLILDAPFTSIADVARHHFWYLPAALLRDHYGSIDRIADVRAPLLILHGDRDGVVSVALGEKLFAAALAPKRFIRLPGVDHVSTLEQGGLPPVNAFLDGIETASPATNEL